MQGCGISQIAGPWWRFQETAGQLSSARFGSKISRVSETLTPISWTWRVRLCLDVHDAGLV